MTPSVQLRQAYRDRRVTITRSCAGTLSRRSELLSPDDVERATGALGVVLPIATRSPRLSA
jgi:hypothetical protein